MADRFQESTASRAFNCEDCRSPVAIGLRFWWDCSRKVGPKQFSARVCDACRNAAMSSIQVSLPLQALSAAPRVGLQHKLEIKALQEQLATSRAELKETKEKLDDLIHMLENGFTLKTSQPFQEPVRTCIIERKDS